MLHAVHSKTNTDPSKLPLIQMLMNRLGASLEKQKAIRIFLYPFAETILFLPVSNSFIKELIIAQFQSDSRLLFFVNSHKDKYEKLTRFIQAYLESYHLPPSLPWYDTNNKNSVRLSFPIDNPEQIVCFLEFFATGLQLFHQDSANFSVLQEAIKQELGFLRTSNIKGKVADAHQPSEITDLVLADLTNLPEIAAKINSVKRQAYLSKQQTLTVRIIQDLTVTMLHMPVQPDYIQLGIGFPDADGAQSSKPVTIASFEELIQKIRAIRRFIYNDAITVVNNAIIHYDREEMGEGEAVTSDAVLKKLPIFNTEMLEVRYLCDEIGFGVFARQKIEKGTQLGVFSGLIGLPITSYGYSLVDTNECFGDGNWEISPERNGNFAHLINHAPTSPEPTSDAPEIISPTIRARVALANVEEKWTNVNGYNYPILTTTRMINMEEQIFFDYEPYWRNWQQRNGKIRYFIKDAQTKQTLITDSNGVQTPVTNNKSVLISEILQTSIGLFANKEAENKPKIIDNNPPQASNDRAGKNNELVLG